MKCSLGISNFLEEISSFFLFYYFLYFFALITEEGFLFSPCYSLELHNSKGNIFPFLFCFSLPFFSQLFVRPPQTAILPFWGCNGGRRSTAEKSYLTSKVRGTGQDEPTVMTLILIKLCPKTLLPFDCREVGCFLFGVLLWGSFYKVQLVSWEPFAKSF